MKRAYFERACALLIPAAALLVGCSGGKSEMDAEASEEFAAETVTELEIAELTDTAADDEEASIGPPPDPCEGAGTIDARFLAVDLPRQMAPGGWRYRASLTVMNCGVSDCSASRIQLAVLGSGPEFAGTDAVALPGDVPPRGQSVLGFTLTSPSMTGDYATEWQMAEVDGLTFGENVRQTIVIPGPRIIEFGWDTPRTGEDAAAVDPARAPFDGVALDPKLLLADGTTERGLANSVLAGELLTSLTSARDASDGWVWVYTQKVSWYVKADVINPDDGSVQYYAVPEEYRNAVLTARP